MGFQLVNILQILHFSFLLPQQSVFPFFLRHIQRTKILIHLIDSIAENPIHDFEIIEKELKRYGSGLLNKERIVVLNKMELVDEDYLKTITKKLENLSKKKVLVISSSLREGLSSLLSEIWNRI